jgi:hypothetical protein
MWTFFLINMSHSSCRFLVSRSLNQQNLLTPQFSPISYEKYLSSLKLW